VSVVGDTRPVDAVAAGRALRRDSRFMRALRRQSVDCVPVWMMRQAGRYLPEYRATREKAGDFLTLCKTPELACEVTLQPLARYPLDAAILFSDILTIPDAMGLGLSLEEGIGPRFARPLRDVDAIRELRAPDIDADLDYVLDAVRLIRRELPERLPLIGFAGSPWTLASYMIEGGSTRDFRLAKCMLLDQPEAAHTLLSLLAESVTEYLAAQARAGADALMVFDSWGGALSHRAFHEFSAPYLDQIVAGLRQQADLADVPIILFTKGGGLWLERLADAGCDALGLDWTVDLHAARERVGARVALQGNLDPETLYASPAAIEAEVAHLLQRFGPGPGLVANLGHGITPGVDPAHAGVFIEAVHRLSATNN
jgi:uroporphyrinogen decarboxylase